MTPAGKRIAVLGIGEAGRSAARWLHYNGAAVICCDRLHLDVWPDVFRKWCEKEGVRIFSEEDVYEKDISDCDLAVVSPGIPPYQRIVCRFRQTGVPVVGELALAASFWKGPLVGITGTNGKTTTTALTAHLLTSAGLPNVKAGNISPPLFDLMAENQAGKTAVLEISSFQLEYFPELWPDWLEPPRFPVASFLNLAPDHLDRHGHVEEYARCKARIFRFQEEDDWAIIGPGIDTVIDNPVSKRFFLRAEKKDDIAAFLNRGNNILKLKWSDELTEDYDISNWKLSGRHNIENLAAALASARISGAERSAVQQGLETFHAPRYRLQETGIRKGITFVNDSKATNLAALIAAIESIKGDITLIAGGMGKGENFSRLADFIANRNGDTGDAMLINALLIGEEGPGLKAVLQPVVKNCRVIEEAGGEEAMKRAVELAVSLSRPGFTVLLSPACASFDMFSSYRERGETFDKAVRELK